MLSKNTVIIMLDSLPDDFSLDQIIEKLVILNRIKEGLQDIEEGHVFPTDFVKKNFKV